MSNDLPPCVRNLSPNAKLAYKTLNIQGPMTKQELCEHAPMHRNSATNALTELKEADGPLIESNPAPDARQRVYDTR